MIRFSKSLAGAALALASTAAAPVWALPPAQYDGTVLNVYFGGATATDNVLENYFLILGNGACAPGTIDIFRVSVANRNNRVVFCRITNTQIAGFPASNIVGGVETGGSKVAFHKESIGGSSNGVVPLVNVPGNAPDTLEFFDMNSAAACTDNGLKNTGSTTFNEYREWITCPDVTVARNLHGGISDNEPQLSFPSVNAGVTSKPGLAIVFGVPVTLKLYRALQAAQGLTQDDASANAPSLTRSQIRGLYTQKITQWAQLRTPANVALTAVGGVTAPFNNATGAADDKVFICRRVASSGTQASFESYWLQQRCDAKNGSTASPTFAGGNPTVGTTPTAQGFAQRVTPNEGSGDVRTCLNQHDTNGTWAIGTLSTEVTAGQLGSFRMVRVDGALPNLASVANGDYDFFTENTLNRSAGIALPALINTLLTDVETNIGRPAVVSQTNSGFAGRPWGDGGVLTIAGATGSTPNTPAQVDGAGTFSPPTANTMRGNPVNTQTRTVGTTTNNCTPPIMRQPSPIP